ncbi:MAG: fimbria major subunit [Bacteroidales bacterium]|nr:fimbria major subunit [Bacteroidales bacterium]
MRLQQFIFSTLLTFGVATTLTGCFDYADLAEEAKENEAPIVLDLSIGADVAGSRSTSSRQNRALPMGGEDGDGREFGAAFENAVTDISVYIYQNPSGILSADATPVKRMVWIADVDAMAGVTTQTIGEKVVKHIPLKRSMLDGYEYAFGDQFVVVANMGDVTPPATLGALRDMLVNKAWTGAAGAAKSTYSKFVMSNEKNSSYYEREGTKENPHHISVDIERVAARLDFCSNGCDRLLGEGGDAESPLADGPCIEYTARDGAAVAKVYVTHVRPFNVMQQPTYLIKRSALTSSETPVYLKNEVAYNETDFAYVVDPQTWTKALKPAKNDAANLVSWYGDTRYSLVTPAYASDNAYRVHVNKAASADGFNAEKGYSHVNKTEDVNNGFTDFYVLDYANENTMPAGATSSEVATGYVVRAIYKPNTVYTDADLVGTLTYTVGTVDLYRYRPMLTNFSETKCLYFDNASAAQAYGEKFPAVPFIVEKFEKGVCYYITYLRHDNGNDYSPFDPDITPMEYGIVRNNIYRLKFSFTGPGFNTIPTTPDFEPLGIKPYIFVRRWYQINHPEIEI